MGTDDAARGRREKRATVAAAKRFGSCDSWSGEERSYLLHELQKMFDRDAPLPMTETEALMRDGELELVRGRRIASNALSLVGRGLLWRDGNGDDLFDLQRVIGEILLSVIASDDELSTKGGSPAWEVKLDELVALLDAVSGIGALRREADMWPFLDAEDGRLHFDKRTHDEAEAVRRWLDLPRASAAEVASRVYGTAPAA